MRAVANATIVPMRSKPAEGSEMLTQLLWGEPCDLIDRLPRWTCVRSLRDGQQGWVDFKMVTLCEDDECMPYIQENMAVVKSAVAYAQGRDTEETVLLTAGTRLPKYADGEFEMLGVCYCIDSQHVTEQPLPFYADTIGSVVHSLMNTPYLWGGKSSLGMDCSGMTQVIYSLFGVSLLRNAREQITQGRCVPSLEQAQIGDLVFFDHADRDPLSTNVSHVGLLLSPTEVVHCSGNVHINNIDECGIYLPSGERTHHLVGIRRYIENSQTE